MADVIPQESQDFHRMANYGMRKLNFMPGLPPVANAEFIEDREKRPIKVLCLGMPRTGTMSLGLALATLGYKCYNHIEACAYPERDMKSWNEALDAKYFGGEGKKYGRNEFARILKGFDAVADGPAVPYFSEDLIEAFPEAKVILTERPVDDWIRSISTSVATAWGWWSWPFIVWAEPCAAEWYREAQRLEKVSHFSDSFTSEKKLIRTHYTDYYARIRKICPKERLLDFKLGVHGYKELCEFLGDKQPEGEYPRINESKTFLPIYSVWWWYCARRAAQKVLPGALVGGVALWTLWRRRQDLPSYLRSIKAFLLY
ncbi:hypothetical protein PRZ48_008691 [Zasmidium cellare]|uniref:P-loop containing nucleoside triphosphate hydrolase protein n=1 Tax=Zasmidium cellare TaxID=395010 RepID=A0ABR0EGB3_ZASCE|nr:hypothetical protein PRZ48_008691 [Zasmidium cellare]